MATTQEEQSAFQAPAWTASQQAYQIVIRTWFVEKSACALEQDTTGNTVFADMDSVHNVTDEVIHRLIKEGDANKWFAKLPSHEQLMKRVRHTFTNLPSSSHTAAVLTTLWLTPKQVTFVWRAEEREPPAPALAFEESDEEDGDGEEGEDDYSSEGDEVDIPESNLPPVAIQDETKASQEEYLLSRLRAAKARVEAEQIRMMYFETTGHMPPDSDSEDESDDE
jgi:hypothetical protein